METVNIISAILLYFILPIVVIFGVMMIIRRKRQRDAGRTSSTTEKKVSKDDMRSMKADEAREARHTKKLPKNIDPETGEQPRN